MAITMLDYRSVRNATLPALLAQMVEHPQGALLATQMLREFSTEIIAFAKINSILMASQNSAKPAIFPAKHAQDLQRMTVLVVIAVIKETLLTACACARLGFMMMELHLRALLAIPPVLSALAQEFQDAINAGRLILECYFLIVAFVRIGILKTLDLVPLAITLVSNAMDLMPQIAPIFGN